MAHTQGVQTRRDGRGRDNPRDVPADRFPGLNLTGRLAAAFL
ncbi:MAG TPA: hypothetical protein PKX28_01920 [Candidatus Hydrogenedentes bacterium]|nr:hypothetical protein [Candidatus Hydrogenedentota bacterium]